VALINCPECKKEVSDKASSCPNCGHPIARNPPVKKFYDIENWEPGNIIYSPNAPKTLKSPVGKETPFLTSR
jgi:predicted amidophosphoribosyltransferase